MGRLVDELQGPDFATAHPVLQAAYAHYAFVCIHPFPDGNGRVARALASVFLYRRPGVPLVVFADQKTSYLDALETADAGDAEPLVHFVEQRAIDAIEIVRAHINRPDAPPLAQSLSGLEQALIGRGGLVHKEVDATALRLLDLVRQEFVEQVSAARLPDDMKHGQQYTPANTPPPAGYRRAVADHRELQVSLQSPPPVDARVHARMTVFPALPANEEADFLVLEAGGHAPPLDVYLRDVYPAPTSVLGLKITAWVEGALASMAGALDRAVRKGLREAGYLP